MDNNTEISKVDKFSYLKSLLEGAAAALQGLTLSDANYDSAIDLLKERFGKSQAIITAHMKELPYRQKFSRDEILTNFVDKTAFTKI